VPPAPLQARPALNSQWTEHVSPAMRGDPVGVGAADSDRPWKSETESAH